jgi:ketosteroid isomerase-like protein
MLLVKSTRLLVPLAMLITITACQPGAAPVDTAADSAALQAAADSWPKAYNEKNADGIAALYTEDAKVLPPGQAIISGRAALRDFFAGEIANDTSQLTITAEDSVVAGEWAWRSGAWSSTSTPALTGKYVEVWRKTPEGWHIYRDIWNADAAPPGAPAEAPPAPAQ